MRPGERISELQAVEKTGASRTPVRMALVRLEEEGLLEAIPSGGFMVKAFSERDILDSIELRGTLEGLAARFAAERGVSARDLEPLKDYLAEIDELIRQTRISVETFSSYVALNARFHALLTELSRSPPLSRQIDRACALPFASPSAFVMAQSALPEAHQILLIAQDHHRIVVEAIENREGTRAEAVMREHARLAVRNLRLALRDRTHLDRIPALALIRSAAITRIAHAICPYMDHRDVVLRPAMSRQTSASSCCARTISPARPMRSAAISMSVSPSAEPATRSYSLVGEPPRTAIGSPCGARRIAAAARAICGR